MKKTASKYPTNILSRGWRALVELSPRHLFRLISRAHSKLDRLEKAAARNDEALERMELDRQLVDKGTQILLALRYQQLAEEKKVLPFNEVEFRNYSQSGEDGIIHYIFSLIGTTNRKSVEMCAGIGSECNTANLIINHGWHGLLIDGDESNVQKARAFYASHKDTKIKGPKFLHRWIDRDGVNDILRDSGFSGELDLFCLDLDGVDFWIWKAITQISPRLVVVEVNRSMGGKSVTVPYDPEFQCQFASLANDNPPSSAQILEGRTDLIGKVDFYGGASLPAFVKLGKEKGYRLIGATHIGFNAFFMRQDVGLEYFPEVSAESCLCGSDEQVIALAARQLQAYEWQSI
ncbi:MAG: hypothetical protein P8J79_14960 [Halioglobus sp.]|nr:hypothetical protein [Halioglobus sp.]